MTQQDNDKTPPRDDVFADSHWTEISTRLGYDVRDLWIAGYTDRQINGVLAGEYSLQELLEMGPERKRLRDRIKSLWRRLWGGKAANSQSGSP
jgi:hypothetical protein